jgi:hypothetical protein
MDDRLERQAHNESLTRSVNEQVATLDERASGWAGADRRFSFHCECGRPESCTERLEMTLAEYAKVRRQQDRFAVVPGHEEDEIEVVVERSDRYFLVDKRDAYEPLVGGDGPGRA